MGAPEGTVETRTAWPIRKNNCALRYCDQSGENKQLVRRHGDLDVSKYDSPCGPLSN